MNGELDYAEFLIDPENSETTPQQIGEALAIFIECLPDVNWSKFREELFEKLCDIREKEDEKC